MKKKILGIILKSLLIVAIIASVAGISYLILRTCGFTTKDDFINLRNQTGNSILFWVITVALQAFQVVFIPISNQIITVPVALIFPDELWKVFLSSWIGIFIGTIALYFIGRFGGKKILKFILSDEESVNKCTDFLTRGKAFYIVGMLIGFIPDDILTTLAGTSKYNFWYVLIVSAITRAVCCAASVWGWGYLTRFWWGWIILAVGLIALLTVTIIIFKRTRTRK